MSASGLSKQCPRCNTLLPAEMPFCRTCGWQFAPPDAETSPSGALPSEFIPYAEPDSAESWPLDQPGVTQPAYPFQNQANYPFAAQPGWPPVMPGYYPPQGQPGYAGYAPAPAAPASSRRGKTLFLIGLAVVLLVAASGGLFYALNRGVTASAPAPVFDRHGLQSNVPLPGNIAFQYKHTVSQGSFSADEWLWKVSSNEPANVEQFYQNRLPSSGWKHIQTIPGDTTVLVGCQANQILIVGISKHLQDSNDAGTPTTIDAPSGGAALGIALSASQELLQSFCKTP